MQRPTEKRGVSPKGAAPEVRRTRRTDLLKPERPAPHHGTAFFVLPLAGKGVGRVVRILASRCNDDVRRFFGAGRFCRQPETFLRDLPAILLQERMV